MSRVFKVWSHKKDGKIESGLCLEGKIEKDAVGEVIFAGLLKANPYQLHNGVVESSAYSLK